MAQPNGTSLIDASLDSDPFNITPTNGTKSQRYSSYDDKLFASYTQGSPASARRALEAHLADTDRRIKNASKLGTTLLDQKRQLTERLKDVEREKDSDEIGPELKQKLQALEKEYDEVGRETARAFVPKVRMDTADPTTSAATPGPTARPPSPTKSQNPANAPSAKQRNQPPNRIHDIEFATEISTSLLSQVRQLQSVLAEKDEALRTANSETSRLQSEMDNYHSRMRGVNDSEQRYKDENWNLETQVQDLTALIKEGSAREHRLQADLNKTKSDKTTADREYEDLRLSHGKLTDEHAALRRQHDLHQSDVRRDLADRDTERDTMQKRIEELVGQNQDLAKAVAYRVKNEKGDRTFDEHMNDGDDIPDGSLSDSSPPPSPSKGTPRHGALESETLKSSLHHAHRMIQNLKNNIHREKAEKIELKRMLSDARDELEGKKADGGNLGANAGKKRAPNPRQDTFKKPARPDKLGGAKAANHEIINDPAWEDHDGSPARNGVVRSTEANDLSTETSDAFETADEAHSTDTDAFATGAESLAGDSDDDLTETEVATPAGASRTALNRASYLSTASDDGDEYDLEATPSHQPRYKLKLNRGGFRGSVSPGMRGSPASFVSNQSAPRSKQNLAAELEDFDDASLATSTPSRSLASAQQTPEVHRRDTVVRSPPPPQAPKSQMVDSGMLTDPWKPETPQSSPSSTAAATTGAVTGTTIGAIASKLFGSSTGEAGIQAPSEIPPANTDASPVSKFSAKAIDPVEAQHTEPGRATPQVALQFSGIVSQSSVPVAARPAPTTPAKKVADPASMIVASGFKPVATTTTPDRAFGARTAEADSATTPQRTPIHGEVDQTPLSSGGRSRGLLSSEQDRALAGIPTGSSRLNQTQNFEQRDSVVREPTLQLDDPYRIEETPTKPVILLPTQDSSVVSRPAANGMVESGVQTAMSAENVENLIRDRARRSLPSISTGSPRTPPNGRAMSMGSSIDPQMLKALKRPGSASRNRSPPPPSLPPLPADHKEVIAAAANRSSSMVNMPPPVMAASAAKSQSQPRPRTPSGHFTSSPAPQRNSVRNRAPSIARTDVSRRSSVSSFASELDERFNISTGSVSRPRQGSSYGDMGGYEMNSADPRMIQAITQTMIGEFLWKYTRKAGRGQHSENRHKRFFWIHPYTRTLYWSTGDPSNPGRSELKAKSVSIEGVRVVGDDNPIPPGLHPKSIVVVTPGRSIKFTAPTNQRHETWFNALSYLLLRNGDYDGNGVNYSNYGTYERTSTMGSNITADDISEFNVSAAYNRNASRLSHRSIASNPTTRSSVGNNASLNNRIASPQTGTIPVPSLAVRQSQAAQKRTSSASKPSSANSTPRRTQPVASIAESTQSREPSRGGPATGHDGASISSTTGPDTTDVYDDGFKRPAAPVSLSGRSRRSNTTGRLSSLTSKLRPPSGFFARNKSRQSVGHADDDDDAASEAPRPRTLQSRDGNANRHSHSHSHSHSHIDEGDLENVRACCDGKHDVGALHHRSRHTSISSRTSVAVPTNPAQSNSSLRL